MKRPTSLSITGWFLIVSCAINFLNLHTLLHNPISPELSRLSLLPLWATVAIEIVTSLLNLVVGFGILKGYPWARKLYVGVAVTGLVISFVVTPDKAMLIPGLVILALISYILFRPAANAYFRRAAG
ncbi:hypothetical protein CY652_04615 [Burkholderia sp. WAC0059]|nr:hypothetical protein CY652_04615 [Burkholderia sp. WAC0059]